MFLWPATVRVIDDIGDIKKPTDNEFCQDEDGDTMLSDVEIIAVPQVWLLQTLPYVQSTIGA